MRLSYVKIENFRNFKLCECKLGQNIVLVGENKAGKSNFIRALQIILDPSLSDNDRHLVADDFWDGDEPFRGREIKITVHFTDFARDDETDFLPLSLLGDDCLVETEPQPVAGITYRYFNSKQLDDPEEAGFDDYDFIIYPGINQDKSLNIREIRKYMPIELIGALRDIASDNRSWRRSPLRSLVELSDLKTELLEPFAERVRAISDDVLQLPPLGALETEIKERLVTMIGSLHDVDPQLGLNATTSASLEEAIRLFVDGDKRRSLDRTSLGLQNALYLTLLSLQIEKQETKRSSRNERYLPIVALEEPEAHLHPHLQRLVFNDFLARARERKQPVIVSTHSPHLASVAEVEDIVMMKDQSDLGCAAKSASDFMRSLDDRAKRDLDRFLDITKAELLFSKGVLLVEGDVEQFLVDEFARILGKNLDKYGVSIINIAGVHFSHLVTLARRLDIPCAVITDGDNAQAGLMRGIRLLEGDVEGSVIDRLSDNLEAGKSEVVRRYLRWSGIFVNDWTLEASLLETGYHDAMKMVFSELGMELGSNVTAGATNIDAYLSTRTDENMAKVLVSIGDARWGKGRFAHRLVKHVRNTVEAVTDQNERDALVPEYIRAAINSLLGRVAAQSEQAGTTS